MRKLTVISEVRAPPEVSGELVGIRIEFCLGVVQRCPQLLTRFFLTDWRKFSSRAIFLSLSLVAFGLPAIFSFFTFSDSIRESNKPTTSGTFVGG